MKYIIPFFLLLSSIVNAQHVRIQILDRGQADGILIRTPNHEWVVIDAGTNSRQKKSMINAGVDEIALAVVPHRHFDHQGGMDEIFGQFETAIFLGITEDCPNRTSDDTVRTQSGGTEIVPLEDDPFDIEIDGLTFTVLPLNGRADCPADENLNSIVVRTEYGDFSMLFTGDAEEEALDWLTENHPDLLDVDVLEASHHG